MDEADQLSDELLIMREGNVFDKGTPGNLRVKFDCGYLLTAIVSSDIEPNLIKDEIIQNHNQIEVVSD